MNTEDQVSPDAETQNPAPVDESPEVTTPEVEAKSDEPTEEPDEGNEAEKALKRMQRRIDKRTADVYRERAAKEALAQRVAELEARAGKTDEPTEVADPVALAREISRIERFAEKANDIVSRGTKAHDDFEKAVLGDLIQEVGPLVLKNGAPSPFMEVVLEAEKPEALLYHLGKNPDLAAELADLRPTQLAKRLDRIEREIAESLKPKSSNAPKPLEPVKPRSSGNNQPSDEDSVEVWMEKERKRMIAKGITRYG